MGEKNTIKMFAKAFVLTLLIYTAAAAGIINFTYNKAPQQVQTPQSGVPMDFMASSDEDLTVLLMLWNDETESYPHTFVIMGFYPGEKSTPVLVLPAQTVFDYGEKQIELKEIYQQKGPQETVNEVAAFLGIKIEKYAGADKNTLAELVDLCGRFDYNLEQAVKTIHEGGTVEVKAGLQSINGRRFCDVGFYEGYRGGQAERAEVLADLLVLHNGKLLETLAGENSEQAATKILNMLSTNLNYNDYAIRLQAAEYMAGVNIGVQNNVNRKIFANENYANLQINTQKAALLLQYYK